MLKLIATATIGAILFSAPTHAQSSYIRLRDGRVVKKHECSVTPCVDCTFMDRQTCYDQAEKAGLVDKNVGSGPGQRPPLYSDRKELPLEAECSTQHETDLSSSLLRYGKGQIICPVVGATSVDERDEPKPSAATLAPYLPPESLGGDSAVGIFFTQNCPGYLTEAARQHIYMVSQLNAREAWSHFDDIKSNILEAAKANQTSLQRELYKWCIAAEPRIFAIQQKLDQVLK
jgi:hypothetical protein